MAMETISLELAITLEVAMQSIFIGQEQMMLVGCRQFAVVTQYMETQDGEPSFLFESMMQS